MPGMVFDRRPGARDISGARMGGVLTSRARPRPFTPSPIHPRLRFAVFVAVFVHPGVSPAFGRFRVRRGRRGCSKRWWWRVTGGGDGGGSLGAPGRGPAAAGRRGGSGWCREMVVERKKEINRMQRARFEKSRDFPNITDNRRKMPHMRHAGCTGHPAALYIPGGHGNVVPHHSPAYLLGIDLVYSIK